MCKRFKMKMSIFLFSAAAALDPPPMLSLVEACDDAPCKPIIDQHPPMIVGVYEPNVLTGRVLLWISTNVDLQPYDRSI